MAVTPKAGVLGLEDGHSATWVLAPDGVVGPLRLGMTRAQVRVQLGKGDAERGRERFLQNAVLVEYRRGRLVFIELSSGGCVRPQLFGRSVFRTTDEGLFTLLRSRGHRAREVEPGTLFVFPKLRISLWREADPQSVHDEIRAVDADDPERESIQRVLRADLRKFRYFQTVAMFTKEYDRPAPKRRRPKPRARPELSPLLQGAIAMTHGGGRKLPLRAVLEDIVQHRSQWKPAVVKEARALLAQGVTPQRGP